MRAWMCACRKHFDEICSRFVKVLIYQFSQWRVVWLLTIEKLAFLGGGSKMAPPHETYAGGSRDATSIYRAGKCKRYENVYAMRLCLQSSQRQASVRVTVLANWIIPPTAAYEKRCANKTLSRLRSFRLSLAGRKKIANWLHFPNDST